MCSRQTHIDSLQNRHRRRNCFETMMLAVYSLYGVFHMAASFSMSLTAGIAHWMYDYEEMLSQGKE